MKNHTTIWSICGSLRIQRLNQTHQMQIYRSIHGYNKFKVEISIERFFKTKTRKQAMLAKQHYCYVAKNPCMDTAPWQKINWTYILTVNKHKRSFYSSIP
uniref:Uncharacterized protein n=1 Tax=Arundo donax TaxID=35708 RepID=A0A0A9DGU3_ARUDO